MMFQQQCGPIKIELDLVLEIAWNISSLRKKICVNKIYIEKKKKKRREISKENYLITNAGFVTFTDKAP